MSFEPDYVIVGAGLAGLVLAERICTQLGRKCLIVEKRNHLGGNCHDQTDEHGVLVHTYGPHYFRTNSPRVREYLTDFTAWHRVNYQIKAHTDGRYWSFPVNLNTFEELLGRSSSTDEFEAWLAARRIPAPNPANSEEVITSQIGTELYEKFFLGYTLKQWKRHPRDLAPSVCGRIPVRTNRDDRYVSEEFQALPSAGYSAMFRRMLGACGENARVMLNTNYRDVLEEFAAVPLIYTGPIDEYFDCCYGKLPYRSLRFERESFTPAQLRSRLTIAGKPGFWQPAMQVNYPNDHDFTRIVEIKHATGQVCANTTIVREYPADFNETQEPYYPVPAPDAAALYNRYAELAAKATNVAFVGRLATYRYYNMDQVVGMALAHFAKIARTHPLLPASSRSLHQPSSVLT